MEYLIGSRIATLLVYGTPRSPYQYQILFPDGSLYQPQELYFTAEGALKVGLEGINLANSY